MLIIALVLYAIGSFYKLSSSSDNKATIEELQGEIARLTPYEEFIRDKDISLSYNGCEDMRKELGL